MSVIIQKHFSDLEDIAKEEFFQFFLLSSTQEDKKRLEDEFSQLKRNNEKVSFATISEYFSENYNLLIELLEKSEALRESMEKYTTNGSLTNPPQASPLLVEIILLLDIYQTVKNSKTMIRNLVDKKVAELNQGKTNSVSQMKLEHFTRSIKEDCLDDNDEKSVLHNDVNIINQGYSMKDQGRFKDSIDAFHQKFLTLSKDLDNIKRELNENVNAEFPYAIPITNQQNVDVYDVSYKDKTNNDEKAELLTNSVWPKSRMLLAIISKMFKEGLVNKSQRGILKDLIIDNDPRILNFLKQYEFDGDRNNLYKNFLNLSSAISSSGYTISENEKNNQNSLSDSLFSIIFYEDDFTMKKIPEIAGLIYNAHVYTKANGKIGCGLLVEYTKIKSEYILVFSHGNSTDIGKMIETLLDLSYNLKINVFCLEYTGFGYLRDQDVPTDENIINDICEAYKYIIKKLKYPWHKIILYGQSVGSGPSVFLASNKYYPICGLILHSPILSGLRILNIDLKNTPNNDFFPNIDLIDYSRCPIFIIHGDKDEEVPIDHAKILYKFCHNPYEGWWAPKAGHNNIDIVQRKEYFQRCYRFIESIKLNQKEKKENEMMAFNRAVDWNQSFKHFYRNFLVISEEQNKNSQSSNNINFDSMSFKSNQMLNENLLRGKSRSSIKEEEKKVSNKSEGSSQNNRLEMKGKSQAESATKKIMEVEFGSKTSSFLEKKSGCSENIKNTIKEEVIKENEI